MRIIVADHHPQPQWALKTLIEDDPYLDLVGEAVNAEALCSLAEKLAPDLVLVDVDLPGMPITKLISRLHAIEPKPIIIVMSVYLDNSKTVLKAGANAFVSKADQPNWLLEKLHEYATS